MSADDDADTYNEISQVEGIPRIPIRAGDSQLFFFSQMAGRPGPDGEADQRDKNTFANDNPGGPGKNDDGAGGDPAYSYPPSVKEFFNPGIHHSPSHMSRTARAASSALIL